MSLLFDNTLGRIHAGLNVRQQRQGVIAGNIANADTPGYRARRISFRETLSRANGGGQVEMATTQGRHMTASGGINERPATAMAITDGAHSVVPSGGDSLGGNDLGAETSVDPSKGRVNGNNVDLEREMSDMAMNAVEFNALGSIARKKFGLLRYAVMNS